MVCMFFAERTKPHNVPFRLEDIQAHLLCCLLVHVQSESSVTTSLIELEAERESHRHNLHLHES